MREIDQVKLVNWKMENSVLSRPEILLLMGHAFALYVVGSSGLHINDVFLEGQFELSSLDQC